MWIVLTSFTMLLLVGVGVDLGGQAHAQQRAHDLAAQAARTGGEAVDPGPAIEGRQATIDAVAARAAAQRYLDSAGVTGTVEVVDRTTITVIVHDAYEPRFLGLMGVGELDVTGTATAHLVRTLGGDAR